eukprot:403375751
MVSRNLSQSQHEPISITNQDINCTGLIRYINKKDIPYKRKNISTTKNVKSDTQLFPIIENSGNNFHLKTIKQVNKIKFMRKTSDFSDQKEGNKFQTRKQSEDYSRSQSVNKYNNCLNISIQRSLSNKRDTIQSRKSSDYDIHRYVSQTKISEKNERQKSPSHYSPSISPNRMHSRNQSRHMLSIQQNQSQTIDQSPQKKKYNKIINFSLDQQISQLHNRLIRMAKSQKQGGVNLLRRQNQSIKFQSIDSSPAHSMNKTYTRQVTFQQENQSTKESGRNQKQLNHSILKSYNKKDSKRLLDQSPEFLGYEDQEVKKLGFKDQYLQEIKPQFQATYFTLRESRPELFAVDKQAMKLIKVDGFMENITSDMHLISQLHEGLDTIPASKNDSSKKLKQAKTSLNKGEKQIQEKVDELISTNKGVWDKWWGIKLKNNQLLINNAKKGNYEEVAKLIDSNYNDDQGASINYQEAGTGYTALHYATKNGNHQVINLLIQNNADVMVPDCKGQTALHLSCQRGDLEAYKMLVNRCYESMNSVDVNNKTPLHYAKDNQHNIIIEYDKKMTLTLFSEQNRTPEQGKIKPEDFEYVMPLGRGAFGQVVLVKKDDALFAMKIMKKRTFNGLINLVLTEKEIQRKTFDKLFIVSEYCSGGDMRALIANKVRLSESEARLYLAEILVAIETLHANGIIHRDIKLDNILLDKDGHIKMTDFGLSKEGMFEKKLTNTMLGGGRSYQIPEVISQVSYDKSVDLYLFGLLAYELMAGVPTFPPDLPDLEDKILVSEYHVPMQLSPECRDLLQRLIVANPEQRLPLKHIKKHPFFKSVDWKQIEDGKLKMPVPVLRPVEKAKIPFNYYDSFDEDDEDFMQQNKSSAQESNADPNNKSPNNKDQQNEEISVVGGQDMQYVYDEATNKFIASKDVNDFDQDITRVPNFSYAGDMDQLKFGQQNKQI